MLDKQPFSCDPPAELSSNRIEALTLRDISRSVDCYEQFKQENQEEDSEFEVQVDEELIRQLQKQDSFNSKVLERLRHQAFITSTQKKRIATKRQRK